MKSLRLRRAQPDDSAALTELAFAAKGHWGYPRAWLEFWRSTLTITPDAILNQPTWLAQSEHQVVGCYQLILGDSARLDSLWVRPERIGTGVGRLLFDHARTQIREAGFRVFTIIADPNASGFYEKMGAIPIGYEESTVLGNVRRLPRLEFRFAEPG